LMNCPKNPLVEFESLVIGKLRWGCGRGGAGLGGRLGGAGLGGRRRRGSWGLLLGAGRIR
ncbi:MAG: hypothetical protein WB579_04935, partial [Bryobacteraceae bacterium]